MASGMRGGNANQERLNAIRMCLELQETNVGDVQCDEEAQPRSGGNERGLSSATMHLQMECTRVRVVKSEDGKRPALEVDGVDLNFCQELPECAFLLLGF
jgi:hypothetical protein